MPDQQNNNDSFKAIEDKFSPEAKKYFNETIFPDALAANKNLATELELFKDENRAKEKVWADYKYEILKEAKIVTGFEGINLEPQKENHNNWFITKFNGAVNDGKSQGKPEYHIQLFEELNRAKLISKESEENHGKVASVVPENDKDVRIVIKTRQAVKDDPELDNGHKDKILNLPTNAYNPYKPYFEMEHPERVVMVYKRDEKGGFRLTDAFAGKLEMLTSDGGSDYGHTPLPPKDPNDHKTYNTIDTSVVNIVVKSHYNPAIGNTQELDKPIFFNVESGHKWRESDNTMPEIGNPSPESAQDFLNHVESDKKSGKIVSNAPAIPENVLLAVLDAVKPGQPLEGAPLKPKSASSQEFGLAT